MKNKLEIKVIMPDNSEKNTNEYSRLFALDSLKTMDLGSLTLAERGQIRFAVCEVKITSLKTREEPYYQTLILPYGTYPTFEQALNYYIHKLTGEPLKTI